MEFLFEIGLFILKGFWVVICIVFVLMAFSAIVPKRRPQPDIPEGHLVVRHVNEIHKELKRTVDMESFDRKSAQRARKQERKQRQAEAKQRERDAKKAEKEKVEDQTESAEQSESKHVFVLDFNGEDVEAAKSEFLRKEITAILVRTKQPSEVVVRLKSAGGYVHSYGFAASQLLRIREAGIKLTVAVDQIAASGGYMMAAVADQILAAPFAVVGSIGVAAELPNVHRLLKKYDIDYEVLTGGEHKRTLTVFGENTDEQRTKFQQEIDETHELFKDFVSKYRETVDVPSAATGESWYGSKALELNLVDSIQTSDQYIQAACNDSEVYEVQWVVPVKPINQLAARLAASVSTITSWFKRGVRAA